MDYTKTFHDKTAFSREYLQNRMELYGFKNMSRMELLCGILNCSFKYKIDWENT